MKQLITILLCLFTLFAKAQVNTNDTNKYFKSYDYGFSYKRLQAREAFIMPTDTVINKLGAVSLNGAIYLGNGVKWTSIGGGSSIDTTSLSNRINLKLNISDTLNMLSKYLRKTDTISLSNRINLKLNISDTSNMLNPYLRKIDTTNKFVNRLTRTPGKDSIIFFVGANRFAIKDSVGGGGTTPTLQQVTDAGSTTTNTITTAGLNLLTGSNSINLSNGGDGSFVIKNTGTSDEILNVNNGANGYLKFGGGAGNYVQINVSSNSNVELTAPSTNGTIPISVNGNTANSSGNITISTGGVAVDTIFRTLGKDSIFYKKNNITYAIKDSVGGSGSDTAKVVIAQVHNATATTLLKGEVVYLFGSTGNIASVKRANNKQDATSSKTLGLVRRDIPAGGTGFVTTQGQIEKLNLGSYVEGDVLWLDSLDGQFTKVKPQAPYHGVFIGVVERANAGNGLAYIKIQNGVELDEIHDVQINNLVNNQIIVYSDTQQVWKNRSIYSVVDTASTIATKSNVALKLNISDTTAFQRKSIPSYTFLANNTTATANAQALPFKDTSGTYTGTITWNGTAPTSGTLSYRWTRIGKMVTINISLVYANSGTGNTQVVITLPTDAPTPTKPAGLTSASNLLYPCVANINITNQSTLTSNTMRAMMRSNSNNNGFEFLLNFASNASINAFVTCTYFTD